MRTKKHYIPIEYHSLLSKLYQETGLASDHLPYTPEFETLYANFCAKSRLAVGPHLVWEQLTSLRKGGKLSTTRKTKSQAT